MFSERLNENDSLHANVRLHQSRFIEAIVRNWMLHACTLEMRIVLIIAM